MNDHQKRTAAGARPRLSKERKEQDFPAAENSPSALERQARGICPPHLLEYKQQRGLPLKNGEN